MCQAANAIPSHPACLSLAGIYKRIIRIRWKGNKSGKEFYKNSFPLLGQARLPGLELGLPPPEGGVMSTSLQARAGKIIHPRGCESKKKFIDGVIFAHSTKITPSIY
jgi:hypothetical protein